MIIDRCCSFCVHTMCSVLPTRDLYHNIVFSSCADAPSPPGNLQLNYRSENQLILQWERPASLHEGVDVTYLIQIANLTSGSVTQVNLGQYSMRGQYIEASVYTGGGKCVASTRELILHLCLHFFVVLSCVCTVQSLCRDTPGKHFTATCLGFKLHSHLLAHQQLLSEIEMYFLLPHPLEGCIVCPCC